MKPHALWALAPGFAKVIPVARRDQLQAAARERLDGMDDEEKAAFLTGATAAYAHVWESLHPSLKAEVMQVLVAYRDHIEAVS